MFKLLEYSVFLCYYIGEPNYIIHLKVQCSKKGPALYLKTDSREARVKYIISFEDGWLFSI